MRSTACSVRSKASTILLGVSLTLPQSTRPERRHRIEVGIGRIEAAHQRRLLAHRIGPAARADAHVGAAVERDAQDRRLVGRARPAVGRAHEGQGRGEELVVGRRPWSGSAVRKSKATSVWILATARSSSTRTYSSGAAHVEGREAEHDRRHAVRAVPARIRAADPHVHRRRRRPALRRRPGRCARRSRGRAA